MSSFTTMCGKRSSPPVIGPKHINHFLERRVKMSHDISTFFTPRYPIRLQLLPGLRAELAHNSDSDKSYITDDAIRLERVG